MTNVIKRGGKRQKFVGAKVTRAIEDAAKEAKLSPAKRKELVKEVSEAVIKACKKKRAIKSTAIRKLILSRLERRVKSVASAWRKHERGKKRKKKR